mmetsp:Transcript_31852/g.49533  ORF Transcript_31852/g.49533 Transcript_31852/m.49533 type:complete len:335 (+) Transcript_31852:79-1083(+)
MRQDIASKYAHEEAGESERPLRVCAEAGRKCVRNIQLYQILTAEWIALVDSLKQLARLVQLESRMPANTKVSETCGRNQESVGTLWDQEAHENAIRILVEEAKVNLCLRMMTEYKRWQYDRQERNRSIQDAMHAYEMTEDLVDQKCKMFEESLGVLLMKAFQHKETLQLMDIPMLIEHCCLVLQRAHELIRDDPSNSKTQEMLVPYYFSSLMKHAEELNNTELLAKARETNLIFLAARHISVIENFAKVPASTKEEINLSLAEGFNALAYNEDFETNWRTFFVDENGMVDTEKKDLFLVQLQHQVVAPLLSSQPDKRSALRSLTDFFAKVQRGL